MLRRVLIGTLTFISAIGLGAGTTAAGAATLSPVRIGPRQHFVGLVNGSAGISHHAQIRVACPGPIRSGETTHPLANQTLKVVQPSVVSVKDGYTGRFANHITAYLGIPPTASGTGGIATFYYYGTAKPIPTTLTVPCSGSGYITFIPFPRDPGVSRNFVVPVDYVNIAV